MQLSIWNKFSIKMARKHTLKDNSALSKHNVFNNNSSSFYDLQDSREEPPQLNGSVSVLGGVNNQSSFSDGFNASFRVGPQVNSGRQSQLKEITLIQSSNDGGGNGQWQCEIKSVQNGGGPSGDLGSLNQRMKPYSIAVKTCSQSGINVPKHETALSAFDQFSRQNQPPLQSHGLFHQDEDLIEDDANYHPLTDRAYYQEPCNCLDKLHLKIEGELDRLRGLFRQKEQEILTPISQRFFQFEEKLGSLQRYFEGRIREQQSAMLLQEKTIEILINAFQQMLPQVSLETLTTPGLSSTRTTPQTSLEFHSNQTKSAEYSRFIKECYLPPTTPDVKEIVIKKDLIPQRTKSPLVINSSKLKGNIVLTQTKPITSSKKKLPDRVDAHLHKRLLSFSDDPERSPSSNPPNLASNTAGSNHFRPQQQSLTSRSKLVRQESGLTSALNRGYSNLEMHLKKIIGRDVEGGRRERSLVLVERPSGKKQLRGQIDLMSTQESKPQV
ncbi:hypothetical protein FGO68_gene16938 [Halteria grandinella]|uniref:Uncharacterized protein n=1 Tax=Halteria grandinella TaxID=5974 RepID=A0A8J8NQM2_HALGN|nr:hypothetical protein FGO68_gene16938 [Halteria grandinella]